MKNTNIMVQTKNTKATPMISCLMVTLGRIDLIKRSIKCFCDQTYVNKELVILTDAAPPIVEQLSNYIITLNRKDIRLEVLSDRRYTLGELRNESFKRSRGEIVCQWDDDDLYHPNRLKAQYQHLVEQEAKVCLLTDHLQFFWDDLKLAWVDWKSNRKPFNCFPGSIMMYKQLAIQYPERGKYASAGEDSALLFMLYRDKQKITYLENKGYLYLYSFHGKNTWDKNHHAKVLDYHKKFSDLIADQRKQLETALAYYTDLPKEITIL